MDNEDINSDLIRRYEDMLRCGERRYFDAEDIEDIAYEYELSEQYRDALGVIEYGLNCTRETSVYWCVGPDICCVLIVSMRQNVKSMRYIAIQPMFFLFKRRLH